MKNGETFMTGMPRATADTNPVGRHGKIGVDIFSREIDLPIFEVAPRPQLEEEIGVVAMGAINLSEPSSLRARAESPDELPGFYL